jgi:pimeloyl-ACP methyl ester carboxylesterase
MPKWLKRTGFVMLAFFIVLNLIIASQAYYFTHFFPLPANASTNTQLNGWAKWKALILGAPIYKTKVVDSLNLPHQTFTIATNDGQQLSAWFIPRDSALGTILVFHGHGGNKSGLIPEEKAFHTMGYQVLAVDFILEMPFGTLPKAVEGKLRTMNFPTEPLGNWLTFWGGLEQGFWAFNFRPQDAAAAVHCPVLLQWGLQDNRVTQQETNDIFKNLASHDKEMVVYALSHHQSLLQNEPAKWQKTVSDFLYKQN